MQGSSQEVATLEAFGGLLAPSLRHSQPGNLVAKSRRIMETRLIRHLSSKVIRTHDAILEATARTEHFPLACAGFRTFLQERRHDGKKSTCTLN